MVSAHILTLDLDTSNVIKATLTEDLASRILANSPTAGRAGSGALTLKQDATGGRSLTWPNSVRWPDGSPPAISVAANAPDVFAFATWDGGASWHGFPGGKDFS